MAESYLEWMLKVLKEAVELGGFPEEVYKYLSKPDRVLIVKIPVRMDDGRLEIFEGYRVQHNNALGPYKGGIRFHPEVTLETDMALALGMTLKNSLAGIPYGGGKGAVRVDPKKLSKRELEQLSRGYARAIAPLIGDQVDIPAPDVNTNPQIMAWMVDEYSKLKGYNVPGVFTAKPPELWGNPVRMYSTGFGAVVAAKEAAERWLGGFEGKTIAIHGFGNAGQYAALWATKWGAKVVAISDTSGTVYDPEGIDIELAMKVKNETRKVINYPKGQKLPGDSDVPLYVDADILIPAALENAITAENVDKVKAKLIVEAANGPTTPDAEKKLYERKDFVAVVPDILANAGGVIMSYLEWVENLQWYFWDEEETRNKLAAIMRRNFHRTADRWEKLKSEKDFIVTMRDASFVLAVERVYTAMKLRGWL